VVREVLERYRDTRDPLESALLRQQIAEEIVLALEAAEHKEEEAACQKPSRK
jgi:hypothetical protein